jgi:dephospho-CoA kinase
VTVRIGLTGPIGCGKSTVAGWLAEHGAAVVDADDVARRVRSDPDVQERIVARFGTADPATLAAIVFEDEAALRDLEAIIHPAVRPPILRAIDAAERAGAPAVVVEAIKLIEGGLAELCDEVWLVTCEADVQRARLVVRGTPEVDAGRRIAAQAGLADRVRAAATRQIDTSGPMAVTRAAVDEAWSEVVSRP